MANPHQHVVDYFSPHPIDEVGLTDIRNLFAESMFNCLHTELGPNDLLEIDSFISELEIDMGIKFPPHTVGTLPSLMRLHHDPVHAYAKPLLYYASVMGGDMSSDLVLWCLGFRRGEAGVLSYWVLECDTSVDTFVVEKQNPLLFIHGVGLGLVTYITFISALLFSFKGSRRPPIILLELPHVSMKLNVDRIPSMPETVQGISSILKSNGFQWAQFVVHSLGSFVFGAVQHLKPAIVAGVVLIDPVCFKLWEPGVMSNFCYRDPTTPMQILMHYHITHELTINHYFHRHFMWTDCVMFANNLPRQTSVVLSELDEIIDARGVREYLQRYPGVHIEMLSGRHHGEWNVHINSMTVVVKTVMDMSRNLNTNVC